MKSFYRSSIQLGFSNLKKVRLKSYLFTHTQFLPLVNYLEPKWHKSRLNSKCRYFLGFKFDLKISSNEHPCLNPPPGFDLISLQESFRRYAPVNSKRDLPLACGRANLQGLFWWANSSPQGKKKVQNPDLKKRAKTPNPGHLSQIFTGDA